MLSITDEGADRAALVSALTDLGCTIRGNDTTCPWHDDEHPSASILRGVDNRHRVYCHVCNKRADVYDLRKQPRPLGRDRGVQPTPPKPAVDNTDDGQVYTEEQIRSWRHFAKLHTYKKADGSVHGYVIRRRLPTGKKKIMQARPAPGDLIALRGPSAPHPVYGVDGVIRAQTVILVEGEPAAEAGNAVFADDQDVCFTTSWGGALKGEHTDWSPLTGKRVLLWPDADPVDPKTGKSQGELHMLDIVGRLKASTVKWIDPKPLGLPPKGDVVQFVEDYRGATNGELKAAFRSVFDAAVELPELSSEPTEEPEPAALPVVEPEEAAPQRARTDPPSFRQLQLSHPELRRPVLEGLLREGETMNLIAPPKAGKSWLVTDLALSIVTGRRWLDTFNAARGDVLILDNELHRETTVSRVPKVAAARGLALDDYADGLFVENLRGQLRDLPGMEGYFSGLKPGRFKIVILDALYRFLPAGTAENDNGAMAAMYNLIDRHAERLGCAFVLIHHASKGNQSAKGVTDVGAGAGSQSRATDAHLVLRPHEEDDAVVLDGVVRSFAPVDPVCLRWNFPVWTPDRTLDPTALREEGRRKKKDAPTEPDWDAARFAAAFVTAEPRERSTIMGLAAKEGVSQTKARQYLNAARDQRLILPLERHGRNEPERFIRAAA